MDKFGTETDAACVVMSRVMRENSLKGVSPATCKGLDLLFYLLQVLIITFKSNLSYSLTWTESVYSLRVAIRDQINLAGL